MKLLLDRGAALEHRDTFGKSSLYFAAAWGRHKVVKALLDRGANTEHEDLWGNTALIRAAILGLFGNDDLDQDTENPDQQRILTLLKKSGAKLEHQDKKGMTALTHSSIWGRKNVRDLLNKWEADDMHEDMFGYSPQNYQTGSKIVRKKARRISLHRSYVKDLMHNMITEINIEGFYNTMKDIAEKRSDSLN